ncbi:MAG: YgjV family protein [Clostridia bacterium]|nr:YgjV family protein [Clostridia bacterium]
MENLSNQYIASQIVTIFVYIFLSLTYCVKNRKLILAFSFISNFLNSIAFILLEAYTSSAMCAISIFRDIVFIIDQKINGKSDRITKKDYAILAMIYGISFVSIALTFNGFWSLLYATGSMLYTYSIWQKNNKLYRFMGIPVTLLVILDSIYIKSVFGVILQCVVLVCSTVGYISNSKEENNGTTTEKIKLLGAMNNEVAQEMGV